MNNSIERWIAYCAFSLFSTGCVQQRQKAETKEYFTLPMDTSLVVVDSTLLLYSNWKTSDKEIHAVLEERPGYPGGMEEVVKYIQTPFSILQLPSASKYKEEFG